MDVRFPVGLCILGNLRPKLSVHLPCEFIQFEIFQFIYSTFFTQGKRLTFIIESLIKTQKRNIRSKNLIQVAIIK